MLLASANICQGNYWIAWFNNKCQIIVKINENFAFFNKEILWFFLSYAVERERERARAVNWA